MTRVKLSEPVYDLDDNVTTLAELLDNGRARVERVDNWVGRGGKIMTKYFVELLDQDGEGTDQVYEINAYAYKSRAE